MTWQRLGARIKELREAHDPRMTQEELAARSGLSLVYIRKLEQGGRTSPSFEALDRIARALGATLHVDLVERAARRKGGRHGR
jgi:transcriptional regulator with XRE-family HTH domain